MNLSVTICSRDVALGSFFDHDTFAKNLRVAQRVVATGVSGMTADHLRPMLESEQGTAHFWRCAQDLARAVVWDEVVDIIRLGASQRCRNPTAASAALSSVTSFVVLLPEPLRDGCVQQLSKPLLRFSTPSPRRRAGSASHMHWRLSPILTLAPSSSPSAASAHSTSSHEARCSKASVRSRAGDSVLPFVLQFYDNPSSYLLEDDSGDTHEIWQGQGGKQGGLLMPLVFAAPAPIPPFSPVPPFGG